MAERMRCGVWLLLWLVQTGCFAWAVPPLEAQVGFGPAWDSRTGSLRSVPSYHASIPISGWEPWSRHVGPAWDVQAGYLIQPLPEQRVVHGPLLGLGYLIPEEKDLSNVATSPFGGDDVARPGRPQPRRIPLSEVVFFRYGVHGQVRALFGDGAGVEAALQHSVEWARYVDGVSGTGPESILRVANGWLGYQSTGLFLEVSAGVQGGQPRWGVCAGLTFRTPAAGGFGYVDADRLRKLDWVKKVNDSRR
ncbi:hypothetical protein [Vitiosangium sp. GDMCC 1.1324]|uniref:hypothetical protein n=1 Tax=Vitiosangium sp. (strain GDMCC 1.1324) TaxID=2138576 RepID=UPI000D347330|nr:hypothetical protein [Vitiosangium sp. GDMCC 1.1324]PTL76598.1 hypothetical protein DAT35_49200 [Vitiosangium sp. GDMCC 1.1324]